MVRVGGRHPEPPEAACDPGHGRVRRRLVPHGAVGLRVHGWWPGCAADRSRGQGRRPGGDGGDGNPVRAAARGVRQASLRAAAHAVRHRRTQQPTHRPQLRGRAHARLAAISDGQLPGRHDGSPGRSRPGRRRLDARLRGRATPAATRGHVERGIRTQRRRTRLRDHGATPPPGGEARQRSCHCRSPEALLPVHLQAAVLPRRVPSRVQQLPRHRDRLPGRGREDHRARARW